MAALLLTGCPGIPPAERLEFSTDARILRGSYVGLADTRVYPDGIALAGDASQVAVIRDGTIELWAPGSGAPFATVDLSSDPDPWLADLAIAGDGSLVAGALDGRAALWDGATAAPVRTIDPGGRFGTCAYCGLRHLDLSGDGALLAMAGDSPYVLLADTSAGDIVQEFRMPGEAVSFVAFGAGGSLLAAGTSMQSSDPFGIRYFVRVWDTASANLVLEREAIAGHHQSPGFAFSADGRRIAVVSEDQLDLLDLDGGRTIVPLEDLEAYWGVALNHDGSRAAIALRADYGSDLVILDVAAGAELGRFGSSLRPTATWSDDGRYLLASAELLDADDHSRVHDFTSGALHTLELDATPTYVDTFRYAVEGTIRIDGGEDIAFSGTVEGNESQRYVRPEARLPQPATVRLELREHPWKLSASQRSRHDRREPGDDYPWEGWVTLLHAELDHTYHHLEFERAQ